MAKAIENVGVTDDKSQLTFDMFFDLIQIIEEYIDQEKVPLSSYYYYYHHHHHHRHYHRHHHHHHQVPIDKASDVVFEKRVHVENDKDVNSVMNLLGNYSY